MKLLKYNEYSTSISKAEEFLNMIFNDKLNESLDDSHIKEILKSLSNDLKFNFNLVVTFGTGIKAIYPIIDNLIKNSNLKIETTPETLLLLTITALSIVYLEEKNNKQGDDKMICQVCDGSGLKDDVACAVCNGDGFVKSLVTKDDARTLLEELKLRGVGNNIVKKAAACINSAINIAKIIYKNTPYVIMGLMDMIGYTAILLPTMNAILSLVSKYNLNMDTLPGNFLSLSIGVSTFLAKNGFKYVANQLKNKVNINKNIDIISGPEDINDGDSDIEKNQLINEQ